MKTPTFLADGLAAGSFGLAGGAEIGKRLGAFFEETYILALSLR